ncbi:uncharacterized protein L969DRAFT_91122 [Mixia osmundae IAM 14324]|uniref:uncharacterized protein n=1 Tax=Mixia osmundae (strain CBS 9802 / IAM 14324 / JCM 22182 / KY 12970) TaxID=764103 RepID=UPI0004A54BAC|nr:uncharacterized protein L969DRAFT_91122 [Mixia osmundae IAM 14324]KEI36276.1 hypothetical protein L969DRAFT_91122 [Mixia osmundae IAM 14324]
MSTCFDMRLCPLGRYGARKPHISALCLMVRPSKFEKGPAFTSLLRLTRMLPTNFSDLYMTTVVSSFQSVATASGPPLTKLGYSLQGASEYAYKVFCDLMASNAGTDHTATYKVEPIVMLKLEERRYQPLGRSIENQFHKLAMWIADTVERAAGPVSCLRDDCTEEATAGCRAALCSEH